MDFYTTGAQVIPLIYVALAFEARTVWNFQNWHRFGFTKPGVFFFQILLIFGTTFVLVAGEAAALWALAHNWEVRFDSGSAAYLVTIALFVGGFALFSHTALQVVFETAAEYNPPTEDPRQKRALKWLLIVAAVGAPAFLTWLAAEIVFAMSN